MRINTITTAEQRTAVIGATLAARYIQERIENAAVVELAAGEQATAYKPLTVWSSTDAGDDAEQLWSDRPDHENNHRLSAADVDELTKLFKAAADVDPNILNADTIAETDECCGTWEFDIAAALKVWLDDATRRLVEHATKLGRNDVDMDDLVCETATRPNATGEEAVDDAEKAEEVNEEGLHAQCRFLLDRLGEAEAFAAVEIHHAS